MLGLRLKEGVSLADLLQNVPEPARSLYHTRIQQTLQAYADVKWVGHAGARWFLLAPQGFLMANTVLVQVWQAMETGAPPPALTLSSA